MWPRSHKRNWKIFKLAFLRLGKLRIGALQMTANSCKVKQSLPMGMVVEHQGNSTRVLSWVGKPTFSAGAVVIIAFHGDGLPFFLALFWFNLLIPFLSSPWIPSRSLPSRISWTLWEPNLDLKVPSFARKMEKACSRALFCLGK